MKNQARLLAWILESLGPEAGTKPGQNLTVRFPGPKILGGAQPSLNLAYCDPGRDQTGLVRQEKDPGTKSRTLGPGELGHRQDPPAKKSLSKRITVQSSPRPSRTGPG